ncbi:MAG: flagellin [Paracoccus sp. (in: a-proteobacteria)]|nr:flagellin [Paracoccus sp. (in: a-proteobacteria)]
MSSILTNNSAIVALQTLKGINSNLSKTQAEISTGKSVANAKDNAAIWAISKVMETDQSAFKNIQSQLNVADATVATARSGAEMVTKLLTEMKDLAVGAINSTADFGKINTDIENKISQIASIVSGTQMNGVNLLSAGGTMEVVGSLDRENGNPETAQNTITVASVDLETALDLDLEAGTSGSYTGITDVDTAKAMVTAIENMIDAAVGGAADLGSAGKRISDQATFVGQLADSLKVGIGALVDADMEEASARLQALQTQQQLGIQSLSIANQAPQSILSLFR